MYLQRGEGMRNVCFFDQARMIFLQIKYDFLIAAATTGSANNEIVIDMFCSPKFEAVSKREIF